MPRYIIERDVVRVTQEELEAAGRRSVEVLSGMPELTWVKSFISVAEGKIYCEYEAPDPEMLREHARRAGIPCDKISLVAMEHDPSMFR